MLTLFVVSILLVHKRTQNLADINKVLQEQNEHMKEYEKLYVATQKQLDKINELNRSIEKIDNNYFAYDAEYKRHTLKNIQVAFNTNSSDIYDLNIEDRDKLLKAGNAIVAFMNAAMKEIPDAEYLLIIEGQTSRDNYPRNYQLSYERALSLVRYWVSNGIKFDKLPCEVIISGSGYASPFRISPDISSNTLNQRFVIHIVPKPGIM